MHERASTPHAREDVTNDIFWLMLTVGERFTRRDCFRHLPLQRFTVPEILEAALVRGLVDREAHAFRFTPEGTEFVRAFRRRMRV